ncbi:MAG: carboxypeptidase regulatory-like domain-containing protein [Crocinitomicaceae bacterium]|nr:carboxypeptidase regulatory-like domain-containing protein [Crocinitomicaceae bacterium]
MLKLIPFFLVFFSLTANAQGQSLNGKIVDSVNNPVFYAKVFLYKNERIVGGAISDFDGKYRITNFVSAIDSLEMKIKTAECFQEIIIRKIPLINDTTVQPIVLRPYNCDSIAEKHCKFLGNSCDIYEIKNIFDNGSSKFVYPNIPDTNEKIRNDIPSYYPNRCCEKKWYCRTHMYSY